MTYQDIKEKLKDNSIASIKTLKANLRGLRNGRASATLIEPILVSAYNNKMPIKSLASISVMDAKTIKLQVFDKSVVKEILKSISLSLSLTPQYKDGYIKITLPQLTEQRKKQYIIIAKKYAETSRISIRMHRRVALDQINKLNITLSQDTIKDYKKFLQEQINTYIQIIDQLLDYKINQDLS